MSFQPEPGCITWKIHFNSSPEKVYMYLVNDEYRSLYWAESTTETNNIIEFSIYNYPPFTAQVLAKQENKLFTLDYFGKTTFTLTSDTKGGTDMTMQAHVGDEMKLEMTPGWVSVLLAMKAAVDFGVDIRNHDPKRSWQDGYADN